MITLIGDYGYDQYRVANLSGIEIDASTASWIVSNIDGELNLYPFLVTDSHDVVLTGGVIDGEVPLDLDWEEAYVNSAAVFARDSDAVTFRDWTISQAWDGIRITGENDATFAVENVWMRNIRDDGIENDRGLSGTITNVLMDGVFVGISLYEGDTGDQTEQTVTLNNVLMRMESFEYKGEMTHQPFFKYEDGVSPQLSIHDSVFAIDTVDHRELGRLQDAWDNVSEASNNYFLNLSDTPLPEDYPMPPDGFIVLEGAEARAFWENARDAWIEDFQGLAPVEADPVPLPDTEPLSQEEPEPETVVFEPETDTPDPEPQPDTQPLSEPFLDDAPVEVPEAEPVKTKGGSKNFIEKFLDKVIGFFNGGGKGNKHVEESEIEETSTDETLPLVELPMIPLSEQEQSEATGDDLPDEPFF